MHLLLREGEAVPLVEQSAVGRHDDVVVEALCLHPDPSGEPVELAVERRVFSFRDPVVLEVGPGMAPAHVVLAERREEPASKRAVAGRLRANLAVLLETPELEGQARSRRTRGCGRAE
jgi:hypothetical protein